MKQTKLKRVIFALGLSSAAAVLSGCGSGNGPVGSTPIISNTNSGLGSTCAIDLAQYIPRANYNPQIPPPIAFTGSNNFLNSKFIIGGTIPPQQVASDSNLQNLFLVGSQTGMTFTAAQKMGQFGTVISNPGNMNTPGGPFVTLPNRPDGDISMTVNPIGVMAGSNGTAYLVSTQGRTDISLTKLSQFSSSNYVGFNGYQFNPTATTTLPSMCVSQIAYSLGIVDGRSAGGTSTTLYMGRVYFYINGQQDGIFLQF